MAGKLNARCRDANDGHGASHGDKSKRKWPCCRLMEKEQEEEGNEITAAIPADILGDVLKRLNPKAAVRLSSVCRFWLAPALACDPTCRPTPWKVTLTQTDYHLLFWLQSVANPSIAVKIKPVRVAPSAVTCLGSWHGWLVLRRRKKLSLLNPFSRVWLCLPPHGDLIDVLCLTSDPGAPGCAVIARTFDWSLLIWRQGDRSWAVEAVEGGLVSCSAVWHKEQLFLLDLAPSNMRLLSLQLNPPRCRVLQVTFCKDMLETIGERPFQRHIWKHLMESQGDLLAINVGEYARDYQDEGWLGFRAFRLDWDTMAFVPAESLGADRAMFLGCGGQSFSVPAGEAGCGGGCIYFTNGYDCWDSWSGFAWHCCNLKDQVAARIRTRHLPRFPQSRGQFWITPSMKSSFLLQK